MLLRHDFSPQNAQSMFAHHLMGGGGPGDHHDKNGVIGLNLVPSDFNHNSNSLQQQLHQQLKQSYYIPKQQQQPNPMASSSSSMKSSSHRAGSPVDSNHGGDKMDQHQQQQQNHYHHFAHQSNMDMADSPQTMHMHHDMKMNASNHPDDHHHHQQQQYQQHEQLHNYQQQQQQQHEHHLQQQYPHEEEKNGSHKDTPTPSTTPTAPTSATTSLRTQQSDFESNTNPPPAMQTVESQVPSSRNEASEATQQLTQATVVSDHPELGTEVGSRHEDPQRLDTMQSPSSSMPSSPSSCAPVAPLPPTCMDSVGAPMSSAPAPTPSLEEIGGSDNNSSMEPSENSAPIKTEFDEGVDKRLHSEIMDQELPSEECSSPHKRQRVVL